MITDAHLSQETGKEALKNLNGMSKTRKQQHLCVCACLCMFIFRQTCSYAVVRQACKITDLYACLCTVPLKIIVSHNNWIPLSPLSCVGAVRQLLAERTWRTSCGKTPRWKSTGCPASWPFLCEWIRGQYECHNSPQFRAAHPHVQGPQVPISRNWITAKLKHCFMK